MARISKRKVLLGVVIVVAVAVGVWMSIRPTNERAWVTQQAVLPAVRIDGHLAHVQGVRNFQYTAEDKFTPAYYDRTYDLDKLVSVSFIVTPFSESWRGPAHTFVTFAFSDSQFVSISVEARREPGETYGPLTGLFKRYELIYVIGDERDLIGQRATFGKSPVYLYPIRAPRERIRAVFVEMLQRADGLREQPEFYNTLTNNCTSNVIAHVNHVAPHRISSGIKTILPGYSDEVAFKLGLIDTDLDLEHARQRFRINERARQYAGDPLFSFRIRETTIPAGG
ncbi:MAG: hypothetical protein JWL61_3552 [Gemmatimonadetes bacterium]|nr:hypothetical protein [Gemmatimonadota bacterium]